MRCSLWTIRIIREEPKKAVDSQVSHRLLSNSFSPNRVTFTFLIVTTRILATSFRRTCGRRERRVAAPFPARMPSGHLSGLLSLSLSLFVVARSCPWFVFVREAAAASDGKGTIGKLTTPRALTPDSEVGSRSARSLSPSSSSRDSRRVFSYRRSSLHPGYPSTHGSLPATPPSVPSAARFTSSPSPNPATVVCVGFLLAFSAYCHHHYLPLSHSHADTRSLRLSRSCSFILRLSLSLSLAFSFARLVPSRSHSHRSFPLTIANGSTPRATNRRLAERPVDYL